MISLEGQSAIITGAGQGLGEAIAEHYVAAGASVMLCDRSGAVGDVRERLVSTAKDSQKVISMKCDISKPEELNELFKQTIIELPNFGILVNNAGVHGPLGQIEDIDWDEWVDTIQINLIGTIFACRLAVPILKERGFGKIINLSGGGATSPLPGISAYAASKAGVVRFTETLAEELKDYRIDVNAIAPGALKTRITDRFLAARPEKVGIEFHR